MSARSQTAVIGLGNVVMSDDGLGVHAVRRLAERNLVGRGVELVEGGTAGLLLLPHLADARRAIVIDAVDSGAEAGALVRLTGEDLAGGHGGSLTAHEVGLRDLLGAARLSGAWPDELVLHGAQPESLGLGTQLSTTVAASLDALVDAVIRELHGWELA